MTTITTAQTDYIATLRGESAGITTQVTPDALALHLRELDAKAAGREVYADTGDRKAQRQARKDTLNRPHAEWIDEARAILDADLRAWEQAINADTSTMTKEQASATIDLLLTRYPATTAHPNRKAHPDMPEWGNVLLDPERIAALR